MTLDDNRRGQKRTTFDRINRSLCIVLLNSVCRGRAGGGSASKGQRNAPAAGNEGLIPGEDWLG